MIALAEGFVILAPASKMFLDSRLNYFFQRRLRKFHSNDAKTMMQLKEMRLPMQGTQVLECQKYAPL